MSKPVESISLSYQAHKDREILKACGKVLLVLSVSALIFAGIAKIQFLTHSTVMTLKHHLFVYIMGIGGGIGFLTYIAFAALCNYPTKIQARKLEH